METRSEIAIVVPDLTGGHGVPTVASFLYRIIANSDRYTPRIISLATSSRDRCSVRLLSPGTWMKGCRTVAGRWRDKEYEHVGAVLSEMELQRYMPREKLTELLRRCDLVQVVAGTPAWAYPTLFADRPVALQVASLVSVERQARLAKERGLRHLWLALMTKANAHLERLALKTVDVVFVENEWMYDELSAVLPQDRVRFAPPGVDTDFFAPIAYCEDGHILSVGRFSDPRKNVRLLFDAYAYLRRTMPSVPDLVLVGKAPSSQDMAYLASLGMADCVHTFVDVSQGALAKYYREARLFVLSSDEEGLGLVILEAMASGVPVVSTDSGGPRTSVVDGVTGFLTPPGRPTPLARAMERLLANPALARRMGQAGRERAVERFALRVAGSRFLDTYEELLGPA